MKGRLDTRRFVRGCGHRFNRRRCRNLAVMNYWDLRRRPSLLRIPMARELLDEPFRSYNDAQARDESRINGIGGRRRSRRCGSWRSRCNRWSRRHRCFDSSIIIVWQIESVDERIREQPQSWVERIKNADAGEPRFIHEWIGRMRGHASDAPLKEVMGEVAGRGVMESHSSRRDPLRMTQSAADSSSHSLALRTQGQQDLACGDGSQSNRQLERCR